MVAIYKKKRLDQLLVERGLAPSRSRAADLVRRGCVTASGVPATKPGAVLADDTELAVTDRAALAVSRGGMKLAAALDAFGLDPKGLICLDIGASTGGFTEVLLERGAKKVYALDVGRGQLHPRLREDARVISLEATDARQLDSAPIAEPMGAITADVSFISLTKALPAALRLAAPGAFLVALVKPQFEAGREAIGKGGIVKDAADRHAALVKVRDFLAQQRGWSVIGEMPSPITGGSGNEELLLGARYGG